MAVWQYKVALIPQEWLASGGGVATLFGGEGYDALAAWKGYSNPSLEHELASLLPVGKSWSDSLTLWGTDESDDINLWRENGKVMDLQVRFDLRRPNMALFASLVEVTSKLNLAILDLGQKRLLGRDCRTLLRAAGESSAAHFVLDPLSFLDQLDTDDARAM
jgi:hypothetical protein